MTRVAVVGAGAWGTALAIQAARAGNTVTLWARDPARAAAMAERRESPRLPGVRLHERVAVTAELERIVSDLLLFAVPMQHMRAVAAQLPAGPVVACAKGLEAESLLLPLELLDQLRPAAASAILTGPNFAREIAAGLPAASVVAARDPGLRAEIAERLATPGYRLYGNDDPIGCQIGGAAKNVIAIAAGAVIGAGLGENARAALVTRGLAELSRLAAALGGRPETVSGLSGLGDLLLTCSSPTSRNFSLGQALGRGQLLPDILAARTAVTEGVATAPAIISRAARAGIELPICAAVAALLDGRLTMPAAIAALLSRPRRDE